MNMPIDHSQFSSVFSWRYGSPEMRSIWSEENKRKTLRRIWVALAKAQMKAGLVSSEQVADLEQHQNEIDIQRASAIEKEIHHDLMAEIMTYAEQCPVGGPIIHLGATSMDVLDNMDVLRQKESLALIISLTIQVLKDLGKRMRKEAGTLCMAFTHIQPAEPTTIGYRLAQTAQDLLDDLALLEELQENLKGKGLKGAVGTAASYQALLEGTSISASDLEQLVMQQLGLKAFDVATQVYTRKQDWRLGVALAGLSATISKFALDVRVLQSPPFGEWSEPFGAKQVGSSAMPFKRNPINSEKINSLCRFIAAQVEVLWHNSASMVLERTLDDSANRRIVIAEMFLAMEEVLITAKRLVAHMNFHTPAIELNVQRYGTFAASELLLMALGRKGADRQLMHEVIREHSLNSWAEVQSGKENTLALALAKDKRILAFLETEQVLALMQPDSYVGNAQEKTLHICSRIEKLE